MNIKSNKKLIRLVDYEARVPVMSFSLPISSGRNYAMSLSLPDGNGAQLCPQNRDPFLSAASYPTVGRNYALPRKTVP